jgi:hypothetical protein
VDRCDECGFEYDLDGAPEAGGAIQKGAGEIAAILTSGAPGLGTRRRAQEWSPLEYGCHVRDVLLVQRERVLAVRRMFKPSFDPMGRDERVDHDGYAEQDPIAVARQLVDAADLFANDLARLDATEWWQNLMYNYPAPFERSLRWVAVHTVHEVQHHLLDVRRGVE